jgi:hypothetical protein
MVVARAKRDGVVGRTAAMAIGVERVVKAKQMRGLLPWEDNLPLHDQTSEGSLVR